MSGKIGWNIPDRKVKLQFEEWVKTNRGEEKGVLGKELQIAMEKHMKHKYDLVELNVMPGDDIGVGLS